MTPPCDLPPPIGTRRTNPLTPPSTAPSATKDVSAPLEKPVSQRPGKAKKPPRPKQRKKPTAKPSAPSASSSSSSAAANVWDTENEKLNAEARVTAAQNKASNQKARDFIAKYGLALGVDSQDTIREELSEETVERYSRITADEEKKQAVERAATLWKDFKTVGYSVEWYAHFESTQLFRDSTAHTVGGEGRLDYKSWYNKLHPKGQEYADREGKSYYLVAIIATLIIGSKKTTTINLMEDDINGV